VTPVTDGRDGGHSGSVSASVITCVYEGSVLSEVPWLLLLRTAYAGETGTACSKRIYVIDSNIRI
jgi:hypothetical protein